MTRGALGRSLALPKEGGSAKKPLPSPPKKPYNYNVLVVAKISKKFVARSHSAPHYMVNYQTQSFRLFGIQTQSFRLFVEEQCNLERTLVLGRMLATAPITSSHRAENRMYLQLVLLLSTSEFTDLNFSIHYSDYNNKNRYWLLKRIVTEIFKKYPRKT